MTAEARSKFGAMGGSPSMQRKNMGEGDNPVCGRSKGSLMVDSEGGNGGHSSPRVVNGAWERAKLPSDETPK